MTNTSVDFTTSGIPGDYSVQAHTAPLPVFLFQVLITRSFEPSLTGDGSFTAHLGSFNANGEGWADSNAALWYVYGPKGTVVDSASATGTLTLNTTVLPWPQENKDCQPLGVNSRVVRTIVANNSRYNTGAFVTKGDAEDHARMYGEAYIPGTDTKVEGVEVLIRSNGNVDIVAAPSVRESTDKLEIQLKARPRDDEATWEAYNVAPPPPPRFMVLLENKPGYFHAITYPEVPITLKQNQDTTLPEGTTYTLNGDPITDPALEGWIYDLDKDTGDLTVTPPKGAKTGNYIAIPVRVNYPDGSTDEITGLVTVVERDSITIVNQIENEDGSVTIEFSDGTEVTVPGGKPGPQGPEGPQGPPGEPGLDGRCVATVSAFAIPLVLLVPLGMANQMNIPGLTPLAQQVQQSLKEGNTQLQNALRIHNPEIARAVNDFTKDMGPDAGRIFGGAAAVAIGLAALSIIADSCTPGDSMSSGSSE
ncbi:YPDG domain-containing protein [Corynebacterium sp.]|uniref:YPDG domain-containing protein n=1 Tax=Corynebacterium sp. TaxID=1720 RepID=UPI002A912143|nr:YPDG domain-containing protein [Corynebacterium sp.]MDY5786383.1 YPDG domain-containing protein [Corynebacterium sp.]